jgi:hypothetical protein
MHPDIAADTHGRSSSLMPAIRRRTADAAVLLFITRLEPKIRSRMRPPRLASLDLQGTVIGALFSASYFPNPIVRPTKVGRHRRSFIRQMNDG